MPPFAAFHASIANVQSTLLIALAALAILGMTAGLRGRAWGWMLSLCALFSLVSGWGLFTYPEYAFPFVMVVIAFGVVGMTRQESVARAVRCFRSRLPANER